jgi:hypothetical protein
MPKISPLSGPNISVQLPGDDWTSSSHVPAVQSVSGEVVMLPAAKDIIGDRIEVVTAVLVAVIVVVVAGEGARRVGMRGRSVSKMRGATQHNSCNLFVLT